MSELKLAISNIAWDKADDEAVYAAMQQNGFTGLEIAPTRIFPEYPYENLTGAALFGGYLLNRWGFHVPSMQSIWYGQTGNIFDPVQAEELLDYTAEAFQFAHTINCPSLVFGCPKTAAWIRRTPRRRAMPFLPRPVRWRPTMMWCLPLRPIPRYTPTT